MPQKVFISRWNERLALIYELTLRDFQVKYLGSYLGVVWAFLHPVIYIVILWFICHFGFRSNPVNDFPFILWLVSGMVPWFFFTDSMNGASNAVVENSFLVKKVLFSIELLPVVKIVSSLVIHLFFVVILFVMFAAYGFTPSIHSLQVVYYLFAEIVLLLGLSWLTSSVVVFLRDMGQVVNVALQLLFWMTPVFWPASALPARFHLLAKLNPVYYIVDGYRSAFIDKTWFWESHRAWTLYFWCVTIVTLAVGALVFRKLRPRFADVL